MTEMSDKAQHPIDNVQWVPHEMLRSNDYNPNSVAKPEMQLLQTSILADGYCVEESTPILRADMTWASAGSLVAGEQLMTLEEEPVDGTRHYKTATVTSNAVEQSDLLRVTTKGGTILVTPDHPFLCGRSAYYPPTWVQAQHLLRGDMIVYPRDIAVDQPVDESSAAEVFGLAPVERGTIARLATSTRTYIANGFAVHNTQPIVTIYDEVKNVYVIIDGFHRWFVGHKSESVLERTGGYLPIVVLRKTMAERMAATVRHNRARGKHSVAGMSNLVLEMQKLGKNDAEICFELGMTANELRRLKHTTGIAMLFDDSEYSKSWVSKRQAQIAADYGNKTGKAVSAAVGKVRKREGFKVKKKPESDDTDAR